MTHKLAMTWTGPHTVLSAISPFIDSVNPVLLVDNKRKPKTVHIVRIRRFSAGALVTPTDREAIEQAVLKDYQDNVVEKFVGHSFENSPAKKQ